MEGRFSGTMQGEQPVEEELPEEARHHGQLPRLGADLPVAPHILAPAGPAEELEGTVAPVGRRMPLKRGTPRSSR